jgi:vancomycin resistance protein YoaR
VLGAIVLLAAVVLIVDARPRSGRIARNVEVAGVAVGGASTEEARARIAAVAARVSGRALTVDVGGQKLSVDPSVVGLAVDAPATVRAAERVGRDGNVVARWTGGLARRFNPERLQLVVRLDSLRLEGVLDGWSVQAAAGLDPGSLEFRGTDVVVHPPTSGRRLLRTAARERIYASLREARTGVITLPVGTVAPPADRAAYDRAAERARALLAAPITVVVEGHPLPLAPPQLALTLVTRAEHNYVVLDINSTALRGALGPGLALLERPPVDATFAVRGTRVSVVPSKTGRTLDTASVAPAILRGERLVAAGLHETPPVHDTKWAEKLHVTDQVSSYTTRHPSGEPRVTNIHRAADILDNTIVEPGATFSLNDTVGPRTPERGFVKAPVVLSDSFGEDYGGGVSQLATTVYNAVFFGGYKDVVHAAHLVYIDRYPLGRDATVNYGSIDLKFKNDTASGVLMRTAYSSTSITVTFYGNVEGRKARAEGPDVLKTVPPVMQYVDDPSLPPGSTRPLQHGATGYDVNVYRVISRPGRPDVREQYFTHYQMFPDKIARGVAPGTPTTAPPALAGSVPPPEPSGAVPPPSPTSAPP